MNRVFFDMDGPLVDFDGRMAELGLPGHILKTMPGAYSSMKPVPGALDCVRETIRLGYEAWIATKPPTGIPHAYADKVEWILKHLPELSTRIIITHDKGLLGDEGDILIDDRPHKANCHAFRGTFLHFKSGHQWPEVMRYLRDRAAGQTA